MVLMNADGSAPRASRSACENRRSVIPQFWLCFSPYAFFPDGYGGVIHVFDLAIEFDSYPVIEQQNQPVGLEPGLDRRLGSNRGTCRKLRLNQLGSGPGFQWTLRLQVRIRESLPDPDFSMSPVIGPEASFQMRPGSGVGAQRHQGSGAPARHRWSLLHRIECAHG